MIARMHKLDRKIKHNIADLIDLIDLFKTKSRQKCYHRQAKLWKLKRALALKNNETAYSLRSRDGNDISDPINVISEYRKEFQNRLRKRDKKHEPKSYENVQNSICQLCLSVSHKNISPDFTLPELKFVVKNFKNGKYIGHVRKFSSTVETVS